MRDGRVDVYDSRCRYQKHRHHRHASSRMCLGGVQGRLYKGFSLAGYCPQTTGQRPLPLGRAHDIFAALVLKVS